MKTLLAFFAGVLISVATASAQGAAQQAQLHVTVVDQTGGGIPAATVRVISPPGAAAVEQFADERGVTTLQGLTAGLVQLQVESPGFEPVNVAVMLRRGTNNQTI